MMNEQLEANRGCTIDAVSKQHGEFGWRWQAGGGERRSSGVFPYFYECLTDARKNGFRVDVHEVVNHLMQRHRAIRSDPQEHSERSIDGSHDRGSR